MHSQHRHDNYQNKLLIAIHQHDAHFGESVVYICEHNAEGAMGLIINKPLPIDLDTLIRQMDIAFTSTSNAEPFSNKVFYGGPCQKNHGFILHDDDLRWPSSIRLNEQLVLSSSREILSDIAEGKGPANYLLALGYAGWSAGQLESEMQNNAWLCVDFDKTLLFTLAPELRWQASASKLGINIHLFSSEVGYA